MTSPSRVSDSKMVKIYRKSVFIYDSSDSDEKIFRAGIANFVRALPEPVPEDPYNWVLDSGIKFKTHLINLAYEINDKGRTDKYMYTGFERKRLALDNAFFEWAKLAANEIYRELKMQNAPV